MPRRPIAVRADTLSSSEPAAWSRLLDLAETIRDLAPWRWVNGTSILGVQDQRSGEVDWCSVMGQGGETFGIAVYPGDAGLGSFQRMLRDGPDEFDAVIQQRALVLTFNDRDLVARDMAAVLKACGRRYRGANAWPELLVHDPGYHAMPPRDAALLERMTTTLECLLGMFDLTAKDPGWDRHDAQDRPWVAKPEADGTVRVGRMAMPTIPPPPMPSVTLDEVAIARLRTRTGPPSAPVLIDWFVGDAVIDGPEAEGRPFYVTQAVAIDLRTGMVLGLEMSRLSHAWQDMATLLIKVCDQTDRPSAVFVRRPEAVAILGPLAQALGLTLTVHAEAADIIRHFRDEMQRFMR